DLIYPLKPEKAVTAGEGSKQPANSQQPKPALKGAHAKTWFAGTDKDAPRNPDVSGNEEELLLG
ncbi:AAA domain-containing protein, partial [Haematococcus lacustris]